MGNSTSTESKAKVVNNLKESISNLNLSYESNDNYINNTITNAYKAAVSIASSMTSTMLTAQEANLESKIENVMKQSNIKISGVKNSTIELAQKFTADQVITAMAFMQAINQQESDIQSITIASDMLKATQSMDSLKKQAEKLASQTSVSATQETKTTQSQSTTNSGDVLSKVKSVSNVEMENNTTVEVYNNNIAIAKNDSDLENIQDYAKEINDNVENLNEYFQQAEQTLESIAAVSNIMEQSNIDISLIIDSKVILTQASETTQELYTELVSFYQNLMCDKLFHYYENTIVNDVSQETSESISQSADQSTSTKADASSTAEAATDSTTTSTGVVGSLADSLSSICSSITGTVATVIIVIACIIGVAIIALIIGFTKVTDTVMAGLTDVAKDPGVQDAVKSVAPGAISALSA